MMRIAGHTPLSQMEVLSPEERSVLSSLWVQSIEEYLAILAASEALSPQSRTLFSANRQDDHRQYASSVLSASVLSRFENPRPGGALGCTIDPEVLEAYLGDRTISRSIETPTLGLLSEAIPPRISLADSLFPIRDQGERGTCVAFASVALREFLTERSDELSEQFLYWACKELDGIPASGTFIRTAMATLDTLGVCRRLTWSYSPIQTDGNEGQGPPPAGAEKEAQDFRMRFTRSVAPSSVSHYKQVLAGDGEVRAMPVVVATLVFNSWFMSPETHRTGKITMPLPGEMPLPGGHAWCIVGYQDDESVPGGGYFIVRNSWGEEWACDSPEARGHALMPYTYVQDHAVEAFSGHFAVEVGLRTVEDASGDSSPFEAKYLRYLAEDSRDLESKLLTADTRVVMNPEAPSQFLEDTPHNRKLFTDNGYGWSKEVRSLVWYPSMRRLARDMRSRLDTVQQLREQFVSALDENLIQAVGAPIPYVNPPRYLNALPWQPRIREAEALADLTQELVESLRVAGGAPEDLPFPPEWREAMEHANCLKVYGLRGFSANLHVVVAFLSPVAFSQDEEPDLMMPTADAFQTVQHVYSRWQTRVRDPDFTFITLGSCLGWPPNMSESAGGTQWVLLSAPAKETRWETVMPPRFSERLCLRNFLDRLRPETRGQMISRVKHLVDRYVRSHYQGNIHLDKIAEETGLRRTLVRDAFAELQKSKHYECYRTGDGHIAVRASASDAGKRVTMISTGQRNVGQFVWGFVATAAAVCGWQLGSLLFHFWGGVSGMLAFVFCVYVGGCTHTAINRNKSGERE